jgi:FkbM family methyltransferase
VRLSPSLVRLRRAAGIAKRWLLPPAEVAAWHRACRQAETVPRFTPGRIQLMHYDVRYADLLTLCPQWHDLFVREALRFESRQPAPRILDCGANIGLATLYFKRLYPQARVTAYEADPALHALLAENVRRNGAADVNVVHAAVWTENGTVDFRCEGADSGTIDQFASDLRGTTQKVPSVRLSTLLEAEPIDLLKLDIEGAELDVLSDCRDALRNVTAMALDVHEFDPRHRTTAALLALLTAAGFAYSLSDLTPLPRSPRQVAEPPFPHCALSWAFLVRAWRANPPSA